MRLLIHVYADDEDYEDIASALEDVRDAIPGRGRDIWWHAEEAE